MNTDSTTALVRCHPDHPNGVGYRVFYRPSHGAKWRHAPLANVVSVEFEGEAVKLVECGPGERADVHMVEVEG